MDGNPQVVIINRPQPITTIISQTPAPQIMLAQQILRGQRGANGEGVFAREIFNPSNGENTFGLQNTVLNPHLATVYLNGQKVTYGLSFNIASSGTLLEWIGSSYPLETGDTLEIFYQFV